MTRPCSWACSWGFTLGSGSVDLFEGSKTSSPCRRQVLQILGLSAWRTSHHRGIRRDLPGAWTCKCQSCTGAARQKLVPSSNVGSWEMLMGNTRTGHANVRERLGLTEKIHHQCLALACESHCVGGGLRPDQCFCNGSNRAMLNNLAVLAKIRPVTRYDRVHEEAAAILRRFLGCSD